ncbi:hypothetical protein KCP69_12900 [Salmonella enterica subsp. enterica]|nr:hypothetical protein KCP69_12900 [Salmonella enterica subsp. enterica]
MRALIGGRSAVVVKNAIRRRQRAQYPPVTLGAANRSYRARGYCRRCRSYHEAVDGCGKLDNVTGGPGPISAACWSTYARPWPS